MYVCTYLFIDIWPTELSACHKVYIMEILGCLSVISRSNYKHQSKTK